MEVTETLGIWLFAVACHCAGAAHCAVMAGAAHTARSAVLAGSSLRVLRRFLLADPCLDGTPSKFRRFMTTRGAESGLGDAGSAGAARARRPSGFQREERDSHRSDRARESSADHGGGSRRRRCSRRRHRSGRGSRHGRRRDGGVFGRSASPRILAKAQGAQLITEAVQIRFAPFERAQAAAGGVDSSALPAGQPVQVTAEGAAQRNQPRSETVLARVGLSRGWRIDRVARAIDQRPLDRGGRLGILRAGLRRDSKRQHGERGHQAVNRPPSHIAFDDVARQVPVPVSAAGPRKAAGSCRIENSMTRRVVRV
jgi:hypothetical protein